MTAQQVRSYKPDPAHFKECQRRIGGKTSGSTSRPSLETDVQPCVKLKIPVIWVNRKKEELAGGQRGKPDAIVKDLRAAVTLLKALARTLGAPDFSLARKSAVFRDPRSSPKTRPLFDYGDRVAGADRAALGDVQLLDLARTGAR